MADSPDALADVALAVRNLPPRLLPTRGTRQGEDLVQGRLGAYAIQMAEVSVETGGKNSRTLVKGLVGRFPNRAPVPLFYLAQSSKTKPGMIFSGDLNTDGPHRQRDVQGNGGITYGV